MSFFKKYGTRSNERRKAKQEALVIGLLLGVGVLFLLGMQLLSQLGPQGASDSNQEEAEAFELELHQLEQLVKEVAKLQEQFVAVIADGDVSEKDLELMQLAISKQREVSSTGIYGDSSALDKLTGMEAQYQTYAGATLLKSSEAPEAEAEQAFNQGRTEEWPRCPEQGFSFKRTLTRCMHGVSTAVLCVFVSCKCSARIWKQLPSRVEL